jgi:hypothetical protein
LNRKYILGATLALTGLATAGVAIVTSPTRSAATETAPTFTALAASNELAVNRREQQNIAAAQRTGRADAAARKAAAARSAAAAAAAAKAAAARAATARAAALRAAAAARSRAATRTMPARASRAAVRSPIYSGDARGIARTLLPGFGWSAGQFPCLDSLWARESGWRVGAANSSGAYGIPQALPGSKMAAYGSDWRTSPRTQIMWGLHYIQGRYASPCGAWSHFQSHGWY